ncbi:hypothetical protein [Haloechinothrix salitolerans]|uniref:Uncharacterized protein n=1 Tax=Haloechinothrix salitolerans TaxID=926830 RepID=A0ABW2BUF4_9PSEU
MPEDVLAHGVGGREDLPLPFGVVMTGALLLVAVTFVMLSYTWRKPRLRGASAGRPLPTAVAAALDSTASRWALRAFGVLAAAGLVSVLLFGPDNSQRNPAGGIVYELLWVWVPLLSAVVGPVWRRINPLRAVHAAFAWLNRTDPADGWFDLPSRWGYWPAAVLLFGFVWLELVPDARADPPLLLLGLTCYAVAMLLGALLFGSRWFDQADPFEAYSGLAAHLAPLGRREDGVLVVRSPLDGLASMRPRPGVVAVLAILLGSTSFDSITDTLFWLELTRGRALPGVLAIVVLLLVVAVIAAVYILAARTTGRVRGLPGWFAAALIPLTLGYMIAHYYTVAVYDSQRTVLRTLAMITDGGLFGASASDASAAIATPTIIASVSVVAVVLGHAVAVVVAHDRAVRLRIAERGASGEAPMVVFLVAYLVAGLWLLFP